MWFGPGAAVASCGGEGRGRRWLDSGARDIVRLEVPRAGALVASIGDRVVPGAPGRPGWLGGGRAGSGESGSNPHEE